MSWVRIDEEFYDHPRWAEAPGDSIALWLAAMAWCNRNDSIHGFIPAAKTRGLVNVRNVTRTCADLVERGAFEPTPGGYIIHDYAEYQQPEKVREIREKKVAAGKAGAKARWHPNGVADAMADGMADAIANEWPVPVPVPVPVFALECENNSTSEPRCPAGEERPVDNCRRTEAIRLYAIEAVRRGNPRSASAYMAKAQRTVAADPELDRLLDLFPDAPADAVACWLHGEKGSMAYYRRADELDPGNVFHIGGATA